MSAALLAVVLVAAERDRLRKVNATMLALLEDIVAADAECPLMEDVVSAIEQAKSL